MRIAVRTGLICVILGILYFPGIRFHWQDAQNPYTFGDDERQYVPSFDKYDLRDATPTDYIKEYYLHALMMPGYHWLYRWAARHGDTRVFSVLMSYSLYGAFIGLLGATAWRIGGAVTCLAALALVFSTPIFFQWGFLGGTSRMFAFPSLALALWALVHDRPIVLAGITAAAAWFYPVASAVSGVALALWFMVAPARYQGSVAHWPASKRLACLACTALLALAAVAPTLLSGDAYGRRVLRHDLTDFPEATAAGRYALPGDALPFRLLDSQRMISYFFSSLIGSGDPFLAPLSLRSGEKIRMITLLSAIALAIVVTLVLGLQRLAKQGAVVPRALLLFAAVGVMNIAAYLSAPYLYIPSRYLVYGIPLAVVVLLPWALYGLGRGHKKRSAGITLVCVALLLVLFGGRGNESSPWTVTLSEQDRPFYRAIAQLPPQVLIAGWPQSEALDNIPYASRRNVFLDHERHQALHLGYVQEMRRRMDAIMSAYFSREGQALLTLRDEFRVTHFLVDRSHFRGAPPEYFAPWREQIALALRRAQGEPFVLQKDTLEKAAVLQHGELILLDLSAL